LSRTIRSIGLKRYLNRTADRHKEHGYRDFVAEVKDGQSVTALAVMFKVSRPTIYKWLAIYKTEGK
jgi:transposase